MKTFIENPDKVDGCNQLSPLILVAGLMQQIITENTQMQQQTSKHHRDKTHENVKLDNNYRLCIVEQKELRNKTLLIASHA